MDSRLLEIIVCPICKGPLRLEKSPPATNGAPEAELICPRDHLAFPIRDGIPVMMVDEARQVTED